MRKLRIVLLSAAPLLLSGPASAVPQSEARIDAVENGLRPPVLVEVMAPGATATITVRNDGTAPLAQQTVFPDQAAIADLLATRGGGWVRDATIESIAASSTYRVQQKVAATPMRGCGSTSTRHLPSAPGRSSLPWSTPIRWSPR